MWVSKVMSDQVRSGQVRSGQHGSQLPLPLPPLPLPLPFLLPLASILKAVSGEGSPPKSPTPPASLSTIAFAFAVKIIPNAVS
jgi:hypothetical protein